MTLSENVCAGRRPKISLIGSGQIGSTLGLLTAIKQLGNVLFFDVVEGIPQGKALDLSHVAPIEKFSSHITGTNSPCDLKDSDVVIVTAGVPRKPGMSREDLLSINSKIIRSVAASIAKYCPRAFVICITNPLDAMVQLLREESQLPYSRVVGMAGILDSARFNFFLSEKLQVSSDCIQSLMLGSHGDTMVPLLRYTTVSGIPLEFFVRTGWLTQEDIQELVQRTRNAGAEIVQCLKTLSASLAPGAGAIEIAEAYLYDKKKLLCCAAYVSNCYGVDGFYIGVPVIIGKGGVERIVEVELNDEEKQALAISVKTVKELHDEVTKYTSKNLAK